LVVFECFFFSLDFLSDNSVEWIEFKNFFEPGAVQIILYFLDLNLNLDLGMVGRLSSVAGGLVYSHLSVSRDPRW